MTSTTQHQVRQRLPQGWIEFIAHGERTPSEWLEWYLASSEGWMSDEGRASVTAGFHAGVRAFADASFAFAGVSIILGEHPSISFMGTQVLVHPEQDAAKGLHSLLPLVRFGEDSVAETFRSPDERVGTIVRGTREIDGRAWLVAIGEMTLPDDAGTVVATGIGSDPEQEQVLLLSVAFALVTTQLLADGESPHEVPMFPTAAA